MKDQEFIRTCNAYTLRALAAFGTPYYKRLARAELRRRRPKVKVTRKAKPKVKITRKPAAKAAPKGTQ